MLNTLRSFTFGGRDVFWIKSQPNDMFATISLARRSLVHRDVGGDDDVLVVLLLVVVVGRLRRGYCPAFLFGRASVGLSDFVENDHAPSSGFILVLLLGHVCEKITMFGFEVYQSQPEMKNWYYYDDGLWHRDMGVSVGKDGKHYYDMKRPAPSDSGTFDRKKWIVSEWTYAVPKMGRGRGDDGAGDEANGGGYGGGGGG